MDDTKALVERYLRHSGYANVVYEPDGNVPRTSWSMVVSRWKPAARSPKGDTEMARQVRPSNSFEPKPLRDSA